MSGTRPFTDDEIKSVANKFVRLRDLTLFFLGLGTGFRITELLSFRIKNVYQFNRIVDSVRVERKNMKGKITSREIPLVPVVKQYLKLYIDELISEHGKLDPYMPLFVSRQKSKMGEIVAIKRCQGYNILKAAYNEAELKGFTGTHSMRKTFAKRTYEALEKDMRQLQLLMGHSDIKTTTSYLPPDQEKMDAAVMKLGQILKEIA